jgi:hypothetical protein
MKNRPTNRKIGFVTYPFSVIRKVEPSAVGITSNVHVPPNGKFSPPMRFTSFRGGSIDCVWIMSFPAAVSSICAGRPSRSGNRVTPFNPARHVGIASTSVIATHTFSGGTWYVPILVATWSRGNNEPNTHTIAITPARPKTTLAIHLKAFIAFHPCARRHSLAASNTTFRVRHCKHGHPDEVRVPFPLRVTPSLSTCNFRLSTSLDL